MRFRSVIKIRGINPYVLVSGEQAARLRKNWRKPLPVCARINGHPDVPWRINLMPAGDGNFYLYLHGRLRKASNTKVGEVVTVEIAFDDAYKSGPMHPTPAGFRDALKRNRRARQTWVALIPSRRKEVLRYLSMLKTAEARDRNIQRAIRVLSGGEGRFMGRSWNEPSDE